DANSQLVVGVILILFFAVIATGFFGVFFLHRVAGPVFRFRQVLARMGRGEIPNDIQLRRRDFFKETADEINKVIYLLREFEKASHAAEDLLQDASQEKLSPKASSRIKEIHNVFAALKKPSS
ncbi:MAG: methyl-accepting chemotaxis protein, partial [Candidatus Omnitrophica bacterium]|nr:methyl-accepting chemotaxis protein [Candidatus Omnitrophota bacterium]